MSPLLLLFLLHLANGGPSLSNMEEPELTALFHVMSSLLADPSWAETHPLPCSDTPWPGLQCELLEQTSSFHVTTIHLADDVASPPCKPTAALSPSLPKLTFLKTLSLINCFTHSPVTLPHQFPQFLQHLALQSNPSLSGEIPNSISALRSLKILRLSENNLTGRIPAEIGRLVNLRQLDLSHNYLSGPIPAEIGGLEKIAIVDLSWNSLNGSIPAELGNLSSLEKLDLSFNRLSGEVSGEIGRLGELILLDLSHNFFTGPGPAALASLHQLQYLIMNNNPLNSTIPGFIRALARLRVLSLEGCGLTGPIVGSSGLRDLTGVFLQNNALSGGIPAEIGFLPRLEALNLSGNRLSGEVAFPAGFVERLGERLDVSGNSGLWSGVRSGNKTRVAEESRDKEMKARSSGKKIDLISALTLLGLSFAVGVISL